MYSYVTQEEMYSRQWLKPQSESDKTPSKPMIQAVTDFQAALNKYRQADYLSWQDLPITQHKIDEGRVVADMRRYVKDDTLDSEIPTAFREAFFEEYPDGTPNIASDIFNDFVDFTVIPSQLGHAITRDGNQINVALQVYDTIIPPDDRSAFADALSESISKYLCTQRRGGSRSPFLDAMEPVSLTEQVVKKSLLDYCSNSSEFQSKLDDHRTAWCTALKRASNELLLKLYDSSLCGIGAYPPGYYHQAWTTNMPIGSDVDQTFPLEINLTMSKLRKWTDELESTSWPPEKGS